MNVKHLIILFFIYPLKHTFAQLPIGFDTLSVIENNKILYSAISGGINYSNIYKGDINLDGKEDIILFDRIHFFNYGEVKCFINIGNTGESKYRYDYYISKSFPRLVNWAVFKDFNTDGKIDIFTSTTGGIRVYKNVSTTGSNISFQMFKSILYSNYNPSGSPLYAPIYASSVGFPAIDDIDGDDDLDILAFNSTGFSVEYHINKSKELYGHTDSLIFQLQDNCWGNFSEGNCSVNLNNCSFKLTKDNYSDIILHSGSCITSIDIDKDGDKDILLGDISCNNLTFLYNAGSSISANISDTTKLFPNYPSKGSGIKINNFPAAYYDDFDNDGKKDLIAAPNMSAGENYNCLWFYKNAGIVKDSFIFIQKNFLVDNTIDVGDASMPLLIDINQDGKKDLLIGNLGYYNTIVPNSNISTLTYYKNIGTLSAPQFSLITRDYLNLSSLSKLNLSPTSGDIDNDGDEDIVIGDSQGKLHWLENTAGAGQPCNFSVIHQNAFGITASSPPIYPQLFDVNDDGKLDLIIGNKQGKIAYYENNGTPTSPNFTFITNNFGNVNTNLHPIQYAGDGGCVPFMYKENNKKYLLCGSVSGNIFWYDQIEGNINGSFRLLDTMVNDIRAGIRSSPQYVDINADGARDLIVGNYAGGLYYFSSKAVSVQKYNADILSIINVFPNPAENALYVKIDKTPAHISFNLIDMLGQNISVEITKLSENTFYIPLSSVSEGLYILQVFMNKNLYTHYKIVKK